MNKAALSPDQWDQLGKMADRLDNLTYSAKLPLPANLHLKAILGNLEEMRDELRQFVVDGSGENPWQGQPS